MPLSTEVSRLYSPRIRKTCSRTRTKKLTVSLLLLPTRLYFLTCFPEQWENLCPQYNQHNPDTKFYQRVSHPIHSLLNETGEISTDAPFHYILSSSLDIFPISPFALFLERRHVQKSLHFPSSFSHARTKGQIDLLCLFQYPCMYQKIIQEASLALRNAT